MTKEEFEAFLAGLDPDRDRAGEKYEQIRRKLFTFFRGRGLPPEDAADDVFNRCAKRLREVAIEDIMSFLWGVARKVASERHRKTREVPLNEADGPPVNPIDYGQEQMAEIRYRCFRRCLGLLELKQRELVLAWYCYDNGEKIEHRKRLAAALQTTVEILKVRAFRVRQKLRQLVEECMMKASLAAAV